MLAVLPSLSLAWPRSLTLGLGAWWERRGRYIDHHLGLFGFPLELLVPSLRDFDDVRIGLGGAGSLAQGPTGPEYQVS